MDLMSFKKYNRQSSTRWNKRYTKAPVLPYVSEELSFFPIPHKRNRSFENIYRGRGMKFGDKFRSNSLSRLEEKYGKKKEDCDMEELGNISRRKKSYLPYQTRRPFLKNRYKKSFFITSYGVIAMTIVKGILKYLIYQRRDNYEYIEFVRGNWNTREHLIKLLCLMTHDERERVKTFSHQQLWDDLWMDHTLRVYKEGYPRSKKKYDSVASELQSLLVTTSTLSPVSLWGFPKGKVNHRENHIDCALREFEEETTIPKDVIKIIGDVRRPYIEEYKGSNDKLYSTYYYLGYIDKEHHPKTLKCPDYCLRDKCISAEARDVKWITLDEASSYLNKERIAILHRVHKYVKTYIFPGL